MSKSKQPIRQPKSVSMKELSEFTARLNELWEDYEDRKLFNLSRSQAQPEYDPAAEDKFIGTLERMDDPQAYEQARGEVIEHLQIMEGLVEAVITAVENEQDVTEGTARGLGYEFERFAAAIHNLINRADEIADF